jgi:hypothetical protein
MTILFGKKVPIFLESYAHWHCGRVPETKHYKKLRKARRTYTTTRIWEYWKYGQLIRRISKLEAHDMKRCKLYLAAGLLPNLLNLQPSLERIHLPNPSLSEDESTPKMYWFCACPRVLLLGLKIRSKETITLLKQSS